MSKEIILYNLKDTVTDEEYIKYCEEFKGPFMINLPACKGFTLAKMMGGVKGNGNDPNPHPVEVKSPWKFIGIMDLSNLEDWQKDFDSKAFQEDFLAEWLTKWAGDFYILRGEDAWVGKGK